MRSTIIIFSLLCLLAACEKPEGITSSNPEGYAQSLKAETFTVSLSGVMAEIQLKEKNLSQDIWLLKDGDVFELPREGKAEIKITAIEAPYYIRLISSKGKEKSLSGTCAGEKNSIRL